MHDYLAQLQQGTFPKCPECETLSRVYDVADKRRGWTVPNLRPSIALYGEPYTQSDEVAALVLEDARGSRGRPADLLVVVGTSLRIPGAVELIRTFARSVKSLRKHSGDLKTIFVNHDFPMDKRWKTVFDIWVRGDAEDFAAEALRHFEDQATRAPGP